MISVLGFFQFFTGFPRAQPNPLLLGYYHPTLFLGHHLSVASIWIFPFFALLEVKKSNHLSKSLRFSQVHLNLFLLAGLFVLILSYSRTLWVALPIGLTLWTWIRFSRKIAFLSSSGVVALAIASLQIPAVQVRFQNGMGVGERVQLWRANYLFFQERPIFGLGFGKNLETFHQYFSWLHPELSDFFIGHSHNVYLEVLSGLGIFGAVAWLGWILVQLSGLSKIINSPNSEGSFNPLSGGFSCAWVVFLINGVTQVNFWEGKVMHQVMWVSGLTLYWVVWARKRS
jgi:O-antigen ligase